ncbi:hypothetical protein EOM09_04850 [bacterium]|nr:hypothetical protein [bacterium]
MDSKNKKENFEKVQIKQINVKKKNPVIKIHSKDKDNNNFSNSSKMIKFLKDKNTIFFLIGILIYGFFLRIIYLSYNPFWIDETISGLAAKGILNYGYPILDSGSEYLRAKVFHYIQALFMLIFGANDFGARFVSVIFGVLTIYLAYLYGKKDKFLLYAFPIVVCLFSYEIFYSKQARFYQMLQFMYFLSFYLFYRYIQKEYIFSKWTNLILVFLSLYITINTQTFGYFLIPFFVAIYILEKKKFNWKYFILGIAAFFYLYHISTTNINIDLKIVETYFNLYLQFFIYYTPFLILFFMGLIYAFLKKDRFSIYLALISIIPLISMLFVKTFAFRYIYFFIFPYLYFIVYGISKLKLRFSVFILLLFLLNGTFFFFTPNYKMHNHLSEPYADYRDLNLEGQTVVATWPAAPYWYGIKVDYWLEHRITGLEDSWILAKNENEKFSNASVLKNINDLENEFILLIDDNSYSKLGPSTQRYILNCKFLERKTHLAIYQC